MIEIISNCRPEPQGSGRAMLIGGKARYIATSSNKQGKRMRSYRQQVHSAALTRLEAMNRATPAFEKHVPVHLEIAFFFERPKSAPRMRQNPVVKPDIDKLLRATLDALTGVLFHDDAQVVEVVTRKLYGSEGVIIHATTLDEGN